MNEETTKEIKDLINKKMIGKGIIPNQRIEMANGGIYLENLLLDFAISFRKQERYKAIGELKKGIEDLKQ
jgi:hypothetical protein